MLAEMGLLHADPLSRPPEVELLGDGEKDPKVA